MVDDTGRRPKKTSKIPKIPGKHKTITETFRAVVCVSYVYCLLISLLVKAFELRINDDDGDVGKRVPS